MKTVLIALGCCALAGCVGTGRESLTHLEGYRAALEESGRLYARELGPEAEKEAIERFMAFYEVYSAEQIKAHVRDVYAPTAYFLDPFKEVRGIDDIESYFLSAAEPVRECTFEITDWAGRDGEYYFRWIMRLNLTRDDEDYVTETLGMTHLRFDHEGRVLFHADCWDPSTAVYARIPVMAGLVRTVRSRL